MKRTIEKNRSVSILILLSILSTFLVACPRPQQVRRPNWLLLGPEQRLRELAASDVRAQRDLGLFLLFEAGQQEEAEEVLTEATQREPNEPLAWLALGALKIEYGRPQQGMSDIGRALESAVRARELPQWCASPGADPGPTPEDCRDLAAVVEEAAARLLRETDYAGRAEVIRGVLEEHEQNLLFSVSYQLRRALEHEARVSGQADQAREHLERSGAILRWRAIGPFGPYPYQSFDINHGPEGDSGLAESYDLGPGRGDVPVWTPELSGSSVQLQSPIRRNGTWYAEAWVSPQDSGPVDIRLWVPTNTSVKVFVGGREVILRDGRMNYEPSVVLARVHLSGNRETRVLVKLTSAQSDPGFSLAMRDEQGRSLTQFDPETTRGRGRGRIEPSTDVLELLSPVSGEEVTNLKAFMTALIGRARSFWPVADEALNRVVSPSPIILSMRAAAAGSSPTIPRSIQEDRLLSDMRQAFAASPGLWRARVVIARQLISENQGGQALEVLRQGLEEQPENATLWHELGVLARRVGLQTMAADAFNQAVALDERACGSFYQLVAMYNDVGLTTRREEALTRLLECDATYRTRAQLLNDAGRVMDAFEEVLRLQGIVEYPAGLESDLADLAMATGQNERAREIIERLRGRWPRSASYVGALADLDGAENGPQAAARRMLEAVEQHPWQMRDLRRVAAVLGNEREYEGWRVDGLDHIRRFEASGANYQSPSVFVLDRAVYRIFPDMSSVELVHQVTRVLTQEAIGALSEFSTPNGAEVLTLRTIKADGTILDPLDYDPEGTTNLAGVEVGDYVEWEYVLFRAPSRVYPGGMQSPRFYFASPLNAMHLSELIVLHSEGVDLDFVPRGPSPPTAESIELDGLRGVRFVAERVPSQIREPRMPSPSEVFPSIGTVAHERVESAVASWADGLDLAMRSDWRMRDLVRDLREPGQTELELARALYDHILEHVQRGRGGTPATFTLATGHGDVLMLFAALLRVADLDPDIVYAWTLAADRSGPYLVPGEMAATLIRVNLDDREYWLTIGSRHAPFGYIPSAIRGQPAMLASLNPQTLTVPESSLMEDLETTQIECSVDQDGAVNFEYHASMTGQAAAGYRSQISRIPQAERSRRAAGLIGNLFAGAMAESAEFIGVDDRHAPLEIRATASSRLIARREGNDLLLPSRMSLGTRYSSLTELSARTTTFVLDEEIHEVFEQQINLPSGARVAQLCRSAQGTFGSSTFSIVCAQQGNVLTHRLEIHLPPQRISPEDYSEFADFLRSYDEAAATETRVTFN